MSLSTEEGQSRLLRGLATGAILAEWAYLSLVEAHFGRTLNAVRVMNIGDPDLGSYEWWNKMRASVWNRNAVEMEERATAGMLLPATLITSLYDTVQEAADTLCCR